MNILGIAEQGLWAMERALKRVLGMCETVGCWKRSACAISGVGWSRAYCDRCADQHLEQWLEEVNE